MLSILQDLDLVFEAEQFAYADTIEAINAEAFGPGRFTRAAERVREASAHDRTLSRVAMIRGEVVGSVRLTPVRIGDAPVLMLGPLAVRPAFKKRGIGRMLLSLSADAAREAGETAIFLVGDRAYYTPLGYVPLPIGSVVMPGPVDQARILGLELIPGALHGVSGAVLPRR
ncbi:GCN5 family acetyltransferase [Aureimonas ureilytica]|uniref:GCN5 family acetyltransferase n=1 Tax=Aureimonas ureilytica TaxID=401562 RepID=A0A175R4Z1_9HYPH|nr:N-acetyltransferase [Aureimonas ureilytica]KTQ86960.1 GCN5 family acetyltransferase [Aureimonas ureilytica]